jgi:hypothetical protein
MARSTTVQAVIKKASNICCCVSSNRQQQNAGVIHTPIPAMSGLELTSSSTKAGNFAECCLIFSQVRGIFTTTLNPTVSTTTACLVGDVACEVRVEVVVVASPVTICVHVSASDIVVFVWVMVVLMVESRDMTEVRLGQCGSGGMCEIQTGNNHRQP